MAYMIKESNCTGCSACANECPNDAIFEKNFAFMIDPSKCTECCGFFDEPAVCGNLPDAEDLHRQPRLPRFAAAV